MFWFTAPKGYALTRGSVKVTVSLFLCGLMSEGGGYVWCGLCEDRRWQSGWVWVGCHAGDRGDFLLHDAVSESEEIHVRENVLRYNEDHYYLLQYFDHPSYFHIYIAILCLIIKKQGQKTTWCMGCHTESIPTVYKNTSSVSLKRHPPTLSPTYIILIPKTLISAPNVD